jgi:Protein of unknown function (DUF5132)
MQELSNVQSPVNVDRASPPIEFVEDAATDNSELPSGISGTAIAVTAVGVGAIAFEAALLPGIVLGVAAMWLPHDVRQAFAPLAKSAVRSVYRIGQKSKALIADVQEQIQDIVAEVDADSAKA